MKHSVRISAEEATLLASLIGKSLDSVVAGVVSATLHLEGQTVEFLAEEEAVADASPFGNVARLALRLNPQRSYEPDTSPLARELGEIRQIHIACTAICLTETTSIAAVSLQDDEEAPLDEPALVHEWCHPGSVRAQGDTLHSGEKAIEADVGVLFQTASSKVVWVYAPFGPYIGTSVYEAGEVASLMEELAASVETVPIAERV
ncbi:MAG TPA: hypothetical protein VF707_00300 [Ardenticatenaceae bacterium]|jgi:hypothetical protein